MSDDNWVFHGSAISFLKCTVCDDEIDLCNHCSEKFLANDEIVHAHHEDSDFHFHLSCFEKNPDLLHEIPEVEVPA